MCKLNHGRGIGILVTLTTKLYILLFHLNSSYMNQMGAIKGNMGQYGLELVALLSKLPQRCMKCTQIGEYLISYFLQH